MGAAGASVAEQETLYTACAPGQSRCTGNTRPVSPAKQLLLPVLRSVGKSPGQALFNAYWRISIASRVKASMIWHGRFDDPGVRRCG